ncbi:MAG: cysteine--tRNA ligase [Candidatus Komeilibacteria bacterium]|nr:cysteine--tRNA ligase [Candidatus Komeilibacteria bacterium]
MQPVYFYNTLTRQKEEFKPLKPGRVGFYTCGPTVYDYPHIGNFRAYLFEDILRRTLEYNGYQVKQVMNITDVGHLTSDADEGEDKLEKGSKREGRTVWEIIEFYTKVFKENLHELNIEDPTIWCKATDYIQEQIDFAKKLESKGLTYVISDGLYFDTSKYPGYATLAKLNISGQQEGARVETNAEKRNPADFALWKFSPKDQQRQMEWDSPWGKGFPGWHLECSAMSFKELGEEFDIHASGIDHIPVHHTNERAQNWGLTDKESVKYWIHSEFLLVDGGKMGKSLGNLITLQQIKDKGFSPLAFRYLALQVHYRSKLNFTWEALEAAQRGYDNLVNEIKSFGLAGKIIPEFETQFKQVVSDDLNTPKALAILQEVLKANYPSSDKRATIITFDKIFGLNLNQITEAVELSREQEELLAQRQQAKVVKDFKKADELRSVLAEQGIKVVDLPDNQYKLEKSQ